MERTQLEDRCDTADLSDLNASLVEDVLSHAFLAGVEEFCLCPGARNSPFVMTLEKYDKAFYWPEERSAGFFAIGRSRATDRPVAVITTSGTAVGELLPAVMEAAYTGVPLLLITADRPRRFRGTGAPQTAEQKGIFGPYSSYSQDLAEEEKCGLDSWQQKGPAHLNICFEEPLVKSVCTKSFVPSSRKPKLQVGGSAPLDDFLSSVKRPLILLSTLECCDRASVLEFLVDLNAPVYAEAISGLRENPKLQPLRLFNIEKRLSEFDGVLRIGGVPTTSFWRRLEDAPNELEVLSISPLPFSGLSWAPMIQTDIAPFFSSYCLKTRFQAPENEKQLSFEPQSEQALLQQLSNTIPEGSLVYLGNSLPIRHWDASAGLKSFEVYANRGLNGIDGQISTFLGLCDPEKENWAIVGDLTALYDLAAPWILPQLAAKKIGIVVVNNGGGQIFKKMFASDVFLHQHNLSFEGLAQFWNLHYEKWNLVPKKYCLEKPTLIELKA